MSRGSTRTLDHIIHLTPPGTFHDAAEQFRQLGFNVIDGGTHAGGLTSNSLVIMADGTYLELLSFTHPESHYPPSSPSYEARLRHPLANKACGWAAYAFLGVPPSPSPSPPLSTLLNERLCDAGSRTRYDAEFVVSRKRQQQQPSSDGDFEIKGEITPPTKWSSEKEGGTRLPFFCGDLTPRELRVPTQPRSNTEHPNGALSIEHLSVLAPSSVFEEVATELAAIVGESPIQADKDKEDGGPRKLVWLLDLPDGQGTPKWRPQLVLREPDIKDEAELRFVEGHGAGMFEVGVRVDESGGKRGWSDTPFGRVAWIPTI